MTPDSALTLHLGRAMRYGMATGLIVFARCSPEPAGVAGKVAIEAKNRKMAIDAMERVIGREPNI
ncbi:MAG: hypothetical protein WA373_09445 [Burkholderiales bacterium]